MTDLRLSEQQDAVVLAAQAISQDLAQAHEAMGMVKAFSFVQKLATVANWEQPPPRGCVLKLSLVKPRATLTTQLFQPACVKIALFFYYLNVIFLLKIFYLSIMLNIIPLGR